MELVDIKEDDEKNGFNYKNFILEKEKLNLKLNGYIDGTIKKGLGINLPLLDNVIVCKTNEMLACVGKKGRGKTTIQEILFLMWAMVHNVNFVLCLQENDAALEKKNILGYLLGENPKDVKNKDKKLYDKAVEWLDKRIIYLTDIDSFKDATKVVESIIMEGKPIQALFCDPVNTIDSGWFDTGNSFKDDKKTAKKLLKFSQKVCSLFLSQHPTMAGQRSDEDVNSYSAEGGHYLNKSDLTWAINRDNGSNINRISVDNVRNKYTGGGVTHKDTPLLLHWHPYKIGLEHEGVIEDNVIQKIRRKYNPLNEVFTEVFEEEKEIITVSPDDAFGKDEDVPF